MIKQLPNVPPHMFNEYCHMCLRVAKAPSHPVWLERRAHVQGFTDALGMVGYDLQKMGERAQRMWVEQDRSFWGVPLSYDQTPTLQDEGWDVEPQGSSEDPWGDMGEEEVATSISVQLEVAQHDYEDDWDWYDGTPGVCGAPFCGKPGDHPIHLKPEPHEYDEHPDVPKMCRSCGHPEDREWHTAPTSQEC